MQSIFVGRYKQGSQKPHRAWDGWVEPEDRSWILFIDNDGHPSLWRYRALDVAAKKERGLDDNINGEYVPEGEWPKGATPAPNQPQA